jgi:phage N-6-adenine-methyltransferase
MGGLPMITSGMMSSNRGDWTTPQDFFLELDREFHFTLDPCCQPHTAKCKKYYTPKEDGLSHSWAGETVFMNPPYGRAIGNWVKKAYEESRTPGTVVVALLPARTDTRWFHDFIYGKAEIRFIKGRLKFGGHKNSAPFPSMVVVFRN